MWQDLRIRPKHHVRKREQQSNNVVVESDFGIGEAKLQCVVIVDEIADGLAGRPVQREMDILTSGIKKAKATIPITLEELRNMP